MQLALQLASAASLYLVDELTRDLDVLGRAAVLEWLRAESERGATVLYATHVFQGLDHWATHVLHVAQGQATTATHREYGAPVYESALRRLRADDEALERAPLREPAPPPPPRAATDQPAVTKTLPVGWGQRDNSLEGAYGVHRWSAAQCHGTDADKHSTAHQRADPRS